MQDAAPATPEEKKKHRLAVLRKTITHPCIASVFVGMVIMLTQWQLPTFLGKAVQCTSNCNMTMSMFLIGAIIGSRDLHPLLDKDFNGFGGNVEAAAEIGKKIAAKALEKGITEVVFDRGGYVYHGRVKALADGAREGGLKL